MKRYFLERFKECHHHHWSLLHQDGVCYGERLNKVLQSIVNLTLTLTFSAKFLNNKFYKEISDIFHSCISTWVYLYCHIFTESKEKIPHFLIWKQLYVSFPYSHGHVLSDSIPERLPLNLYWIILQLRFVDVEIWKYNFKKYIYLGRFNDFSMATVITYFAASTSVAPS